MKETTKQLRSIRCANHLNREAAARCPVCHRHFCRECVTENKGKMLCRGCLNDQGWKREKNNTKFKIWANLCFLILFLGGFFITWLFVLWSGRMLASIPQKYHNAKSLF